MGGGGYWYLRFQLCFCWVSIIFKSVWKDYISQVMEIFIYVVVLRDLVRFSQGVVIELNIVLLWDLLKIVDEWYYQFYIRSFFFSEV